MNAEPSTTAVSRRAQQRAQAALDLGRAEEALREAGTALAADPTDPYSYALVAAAQLGLGLREQALEVARSGLAHDPDSEWLHRICAVALMYGRNYVDAFMAIRESLRINPDNGSAHYVQGMILQRSSSYQQAQEAYARALELEPDNATYHFSLGSLYASRAELKLAERHLRAALRSEPNYAAALNELGVLMRRQGRSREALTAFRSAIGVDPTNLEAKVNAHALVKEKLRVSGAAGALVGVAAVAKSGWLNIFVLSRGAEAALRGSTLLVVVATALGALAIGLLLSRRGGRPTEDEESALQKLEPELWSLYRKLDSDLKSRVQRVAEARAPPKRSLHRAPAAARRSVGSDRPIPGNFRGEPPGG